MSRRSSLQRTVLVTLAVLVAFGAGLLVASLGRQDESRLRAPSEDASRDGRDMYSARLSKDPHFLAQQRRNVESLESICATSGEFCDEAKAARASLDRLREGR